MSEAIEIYTNSARIITSVYDVTIVLSLNDLDENKKVRTKEVARVRMSPQHALALSLLLNKHIEIYGEQFQKVFLPEELLKSLKAESKGETVES